jgi:O-antigen/teichoic acid export membrane protein
MTTENSAALRDSVAYGLSKAVPGLLGFLTVVVFIRAMGQEEYGKYSLAFTVVAMTSAFFTGWLNQSLLRYYSQVRGAPTVRRDVLLALVLSTGIGVVMLALVYLLGIFDRDAYTLFGFMTLLFAFAASSFYQLRVAIFQAQIQPRKIVVLGAIQATIALCLPVLLFVMVKRTYAIALIGLAISYASPLYGQIFRLRNRAAQTRLGVESGPLDFSLVRKLFRYGWALSFWFAAVAMLQVCDRYFIQRFFGFAETGIYSGVYDLIFRGYSLVFIPITFAVHPRMMRLWNAGARAQTWSLWRWAIAVQVGIFACLMVLLFTLPDVARMIFVQIVGDHTSSLVLPLTAGGFLWQFALLAHKPLEIAGRTWLMLVAAIAALSVNVAVNVSLLPVHGMIVTAYATVATGLLYVSLVLIFGAIARPHERLANE